MMKRSPILIVDDESPMIELLSLYLKQAGYEVEECLSGKEAISLIKNNDYLLVILDIMMSDMGGFEVCRIVREYSNVPIIMLTARNQLNDKVFGLRLGADDYITKPFEKEELLARIEVVVRREMQNNLVTDKDIITFENLVLNKVSHQVFVSEVELDLTPKEFAILQLFLMNKGRVFSRDDVLSFIWGHDFLGDYRTVDTHIKNLREKLSSVGIPGQKVIKTVWGVGYKFNEDKT
ncbi:DNA-binding response regulator [Niallia circulans]|uniref:response regulator transcription factor n=1 Tax=Niallia circulans TaxID=1397 RepID=UPI000BA5F1A1|nr:response regulator transcription factor [Niallia circulans]PAE10438.1 DNA-binding response regulator [Niallia circulans]